MVGLYCLCSILLFPLCESTFYSLRADNATGIGSVSLDQYQGKVSLVVNVASECGYTDSNYKALVQLQQEYQGKGFTVLAFPSNQFDQQEPGTNQQIIDFAIDTYGANFPIFSKTNVTGDVMCDVYQYLTRITGSFPSWNFCKYLVDRRGEVVQFFSQKDDFSAIRSSVEYLLRKKFDEL